VTILSLWEYQIQTFTGSDVNTPTIRHRPIIGGIFGQGRYSLATQPCVENGLHAVRFMVIDPRRGSVLSVADNKLGARTALEFVSMRV